MDTNNITDQVSEQSFKQIDYRFQAMGLSIEWLFLFFIYLLITQLANMFVGDKWRSIIFICYVLVSVIWVISFIINIRKKKYIVINGHMICYQNVQLKPEEISSIALISNGLVQINTKQGNIFKRTLQLVLKHESDRLDFKTAMQQYGKSYDVKINDEWSLKDLQRKKH